MQYLKPSFSGPVSNGKISQTDYEIAVGIRHPDGILVQPKVATVKLTHYRDYVLLNPLLPGPALRTSRKSK